MGADRENAARLLGQIDAVLARVRWLHIAEASVFGLAALLLLLALSTVPPSTQNPAFGPAWLGALFAAASWLHERHRTPLESIDRVDRAEGFNGALRTAYELAIEPAGVLLEPLLIERVLARFDARRASAVLRPRPLPALGVFALTLGLFLQRSTWHEQGDLEPAPGDALAAALDQLASQPDTAHSSGIAPARLAAMARELSLNPRSALEAHSELVRDLTRLESALRSATSSRGALDPRQNALAALERLRDRGDLARMAPPALPLDSKPGKSSSDPAGASSGSGPGLTASRGDGTMSGSTPTTMSSTNDLPGSAPLPANPGSEHGLAQSGGWPSEYDALIERWDAILARQASAGARKPK